MAIGSGIVVFDQASNAWVALISVVRSWKTLFGSTVMFGVSWSSPFTSGFFLSLPFWVFFVAFLPAFFLPLPVWAFFVALLPALFLVVFVSQPSHLNSFSSIVAVASGCFLSFIQTA